VLRVLDAPAQVALVGVGAEHTLVDVEHLAIRAVADRVGVDLEAVPDRDLRRARDVLRRLQGQPGARRQIDVRLEQPRAVRAERAVDLALDRAHGEEVVAVAD
jgi:hypothetical protein